MIRLLVLPFLAGSLRPNAPGTTAAPAAVVASHTPAAVAASLAPATPALPGHGFTWMQLPPCPQNAPNCRCTDPPVCNPRQVSSCNFVQQKDDGVCVYQCAYSEHCTDCLGREFDRPAEPGNRYRLDGFPVGGCPAADCGLCLG